MYVVSFETWGCCVGSFTTRAKAQAWLDSIHPERASDGVIEILDDPVKTARLWGEWDEEMDDAPDI